MNNSELKNRIKELERELENLKSGKISNVLKNEVLFRQAIEKTIPSGIAIVDETGKQVYVNQAFCDLVGCDESELINKYPPYVYWPQDEIENIAHTFDQTIKNKAPKEGFELIFCHKSGKLIPVRVIISPFQQENNKTFWLANVIDVSEIKNNEKITLETKNHFKDIVETAHDLIWECDSNGVFTYLNPSWEGVLGYPIEEMLNTPFSFFQSTEYASRDLLHFHSIFRGKEMLNYETVFRHKQGHDVHLSFNSRSHFDQIENVLMCRGSARDITQRKIAEQALKESEAQFRLVFENSIDAIFWADPNTGILINCNRAALELFERTESEIIGHPQTILHPADKKDQVIERFRQNTLKGGMKSLEVEIITKSGEIKFADISATLIEFNDRQIIQGIFRDITERKKTEQTLKEQEKQLKLLLKGTLDYYFRLKIGTDGRPTMEYISENYAAITGRNLLDVQTAESWKNIIHPDDVDTVFKSFNTIIKTGKNVNLECRSFLNNNIRYIELNAVPIINPQDNNVTYILGSVKDITFKKQAELSLKESEAKFRLLNSMFSEMLKLQDLESFYRYITTSLQKRLPQTIILYNSINRQNNEACLENVAGLNHELFNEFLKISGFNPIGRKYKLVSKHIDFVRSGEFVEFKGGLAEFAESELPVFVAKAIEKIAGIYKIYTIGISKDENLLASIHFFTFNKAIITDRDFIETFVKQAGIILQKKIAEIALHDSETKFRLLADNSQNIIYRMSLKTGKFEYVSPACEKILGYTPQEHYENPLLVRNLIHPDFIEYFNREWAKVQNNEMSETNEYKIIDKNKNEKWLFQQNFLIRDENSKAIAIEGNVIDITERKQAEQALKESEEKFSKMFKSNPNAMSLSTIKEGLLLDVNAEFLKLTGWNFEEVIGHSVSELNLWVHPEQRDHIINKFRNTDIIENVELEFRGKSGKISQLLWSAIKVEMGNETYLLVSTINISDRKKIEQALKENEEKYRTLFENVGEGIGFVNSDEEFVFANPVAENIFGVNSGELIGKNLREFLDEEQCLVVHNQTGVRMQGQSSNYDFEIIRPDGTKRDILITAVPQFDEIGKFIGAHGIFRDITERKQAEKALKDSEERYRELFEVNIDGISIFLFNPHDQSSTIIDLNESAAKMLGYKKEEMINKNPNDFEKESSNEKINKRIDDLKTCGSSNFETILIHKDGHDVNVEINVKLINYNNQYALMNITRDITERKFSGRALQESETKFKEIIQQINDGIIVFNEQGKIVIWNKGVEKITGIHAPDAMGRNFADIQYQLFPPNIKDKEVIDKQIKSIISLQDHDLFNRILNDEIVALNSDHLKNTQSILFPVRFKDHNLFCVVMRDNTEIKQYEKQLLQMNADKDHFISILAHDLKTPFNGFLGLSELLSKNIREYDLDKIEMFVNLINKNAQSTYNLLEDILIWAKAQSGKILHKPQKINFTEICNEIIEMLKQNAFIKEISIHPVTSDEIVIFADVYMLKAILRNLLSNAIKFTNKGGCINISVMQNQTYVTIIVSDNGIGIEPNILSKLFDISQVFSTEGTEKEKGTGLGLLLCKEFVEKHRCKIWVESDLGKGSEFKFTMPIYAGKESMQA